ncbi:sensor histidine kinase [Agromyces atrinae]|uniref:Sensor-like histidine kinase SenX3 n=1 Tax=Agromyces atrinae TaxID=592376 RepID=A0A4V1R252_9MICO|nr:HAMP domain-containing sensor histidine kinase [Agromyces atrinae]NYD68568.1 two-component system OmpR family sensor kinase [Agromyces atrinae]RXZ85946.1 HAMP domain-containing histidine kinase [Agromyces atrinae]
MTAKRAVLAVIPLVAGAVLAVILLVADANPWLRIGVPISTLALGAGAIVSAVLLLRGRRAGRERAAVDRAVAEAREAERQERRRFLARLDHELKNPVTAIRTALAAAPTDSPLLDVAAKQAARVSALVDDLAKLADLETRPIERAAVDLESVARDAVDAAEVAHGGRDFHVEFPTVPWPVPPVRGDADLLVVAVYNLVANASKYSDPGARIEVRASEADGFVSLEVSDTGWGIAADDLAGVWDELARGQNARGVDGSGLGLAIVRVIAERHGGSAVIRSEPGVGTRVVLRLPAV